MRTFILSCCLALAPSLAFAQSSAPDEAALKNIPIFPAWQSLGAECHSKMPDAQSENTTAILIAPGYLVAPSASFDAAEDLMVDSGVCLYDPRTRRIATGHLVDAHLYSGYRFHLPGMVLIRTDETLSGTPVSLATPDAVPAFSLHYPPTLVVGDRLTFKGEKGGYTACGPSYERAFPLIGLMDGPLPGLLCSRIKVDDSAGTLLFTSDYKFAGMLTFRDQHQILRGPDLPRIRQFVIMYFDSFGRYVKDKPKL